MFTDQLHTAIPATAVRSASSQGRRSVILAIRAVVGYLLVVAYGAAFTYGQFYVYGRVGPPWREILLIASLVVEYAGLARLSTWMYYWVDLPALVEQHAWDELPVVLATYGAPDDADVEKAGQAARMLDRPVRLVSLTTPMESEDWWSRIEGVRARLIAQGVRVSAIGILTQRPQETLGQILSGTRAPYIISGQLGKLVERPVSEDTGAPG